MNKNIFVPGVGQHENIGDIILRRPLINWLREYGQLHIYVGSSTEGYDKGLGIRVEDVLYHSFIKWYLTALWHALTLKAHYVFKPGEIQLTILGLKEHIVVLPLLLFVRLTGGKVIRVGSGARNFAKLPRLFMKPSIWFSNVVRWRDAKTTAFMQAGETMPDLAYATGTEISEHLDFSSRNALVLSMRGDREHPENGWLEAVSQYADIHHLKIYVITQVLRDSELSKKLAKRLNATLVDWDGESHDVQEQLLRDLYARTHTVVSDRLHVLITAFTHGALPVGMLSYGSDKINRHFEVIGVEKISIFTSGLTQADIFSEMTKIYERRSVVLGALTYARVQLSKVKQLIAKTLVTE